MAITHVVDSGEEAGLQAPDDDGDDAGDEEEEEEPEGAAAPRASGFLALLTGEPGVTGSSYSVS